MAKKTAVKKVAVKKAKQLPLAPIVKGESKTYIKGGVIFEVTAVIPTQSYGNIQPRIQVIVDTIEEGRALVMPVIEMMYKTYSESKPQFLGKVAVTEKIVTPPTAQTVTTPAQPTTPPAPQATATGPADATANATAPAKPKSEFVLKAEKMLSLAATEDAAIRIQDQIEKSTKIAEEDKPALLTLCLQRRGELAK
jgi:hypothetical protein